jgi:TldD protein
MMSRLNRRDVLGVGLTGAAALTLPSFLAQSGSPAYSALLDDAPDDPFRDWFGIDEKTIAKVMAELMSGGADFADVYFQHSRSNSVRMEDGLVSSASTNIDQGVGLRVVIGDQVGYAFTEDLTLESMLGAARTAAAIAKGNNQSAPPQRFTLGNTPSFYKANVPWDQVGIDAKLPLLFRAESLTRELDPAIKKIGVDRR